MVRRNLAPPVRPVNSNPWDLRAQMEALQDRVTVLERLQHRNALVILALRFRQPWSQKVK